MFELKKEESLSSFSLQVATIQGTYASIMVTLQHANTLASVLFGKTRRAVFSSLFSHTDESFYLRQIARRANVGMGALQREVKLLSDAGIIRRTVRGKQVYYRASPDSGNT